MVEGLEWLDQSIAWDRAHPVRYRARRIWYWTTHPAKVYKTYVYWPIRTFIERGRRGWSVRDAWSLDTYLARVMAESIRHLRLNSHGYPNELTPEKWASILEEMEIGFSLWADHMEYPGGEEEAYLAVQNSLRVMTEWFGNLWD